MQELIAILKPVFPTIQIEHLNVALKGGHFDSLDQVAIRVAIEKHFGYQVTDQIWYGFTDITTAYKHFSTNSNAALSSTKAESITFATNCEIGMPEMANFALSENWLFKQLGAYHWAMLCEGFNKKSAEFRDQSGNRLYATFVRIRFQCASLFKFKENASLNFTGTLNRITGNSYLSKITGTCLSNDISADLLTCFTTRHNNDNNVIAKGEPLENAEKIASLPGHSSFLNEYRLMKKGLVEEVYCNPFTFPVTNTVIFEGEYPINPYYEVNGVGLMYFASYPVLADINTLSFIRENYPDIDFETYDSVFRDVFYFANCNKTDIVVSKLNSFQFEGQYIFYSSSLFRKSDNTLMARIFAAKVAR